MRLKQLTLTLATVLLGATLLVGCGDSATSGSTADTTPKTVSGIYDAVSTANPIANPRELDDMSVELDFMLPMDSIAEYKGVASNDGGDAGMVIVIQATEGNAQAVYDALSTYADNQVLFWGNYEEFADAKASVEDAVLMMEGDFVVQAFASADGDVSAIETAVTDALG